AHSTIGSLPSSVVSRVERAVHQAITATKQTKIAIAARSGIRVMNPHAAFGDTHVLRGSRARTLDPSRARAQPCAHAETQERRPHFANRVGRGGGGPCPWSAGAASLVHRTDRRRAFVESDLVEREVPVRIGAEPGELLDQPPDRRTARARVGE